MDFLKVLFEGGAITFEQFIKLSNENGIKLADLSSGKYVDKSKYDDDLAAKDDIISKMTEKASERENDFAKLKKQLEDTKEADLAELKTKIEELKAKYSADTQLYKEQIEHHTRLSVAKDIASHETFTSEAAKKMFINDLMDKQLTLEDGKFVGAEDFISSYKEANADSFAQVAQPTFTAPTTGNPGNPTNYETRLADARAKGNTAEAVAIKREAAENNIFLM